eukprot:PITA_24837
MKLVVDDRPLILVLYVDDLFLTGADPLIYKRKRELDFKFGMVDCKPMTTPMELNFKKLCGSAAGPELGNAFEFRQLIVALMFLVNSRLDICFAVSMLSQYMVEPHHSHWIGAKNLLRYRWGIIAHRLRYTARSVKLLGYSDIDWAGSMSGKQKSVALSTAEVGFITAGMGLCEAGWSKKLFSELFGHVLDTTVILCDSQSQIRLSDNPVFHDRSKHTDIRHHFIWDMVQQGAIRLHHIGTDVQVVDILTKPLGKVKFLAFHE